jgi:hypothetical protein
MEAAVDRLIGLKMENVSREVGISVGQLATAPSTITK